MFTWIVFVLLTAKCNLCDNITEVTPHNLTEGETMEIGTIEPQGIWCYVCSGYNNNTNQQSVFNNPYCIDGKFEGSQVETYFSVALHSPLCYTLSVKAGNEVFTERGIAYKTKATIGDLLTNRTDWSEGQIYGYFCEDNLCNSSSKINFNLMLFVPVFFCTAGKFIKTFNCL